MANPNFFYFTGENEYALWHEVHRWKTGFVQKHGEENLVRLDGPQQTASSLMDAVSVLPFIAEKRLVLCDGVPKIDKKQFIDLLEAIHPQTLFLVYASKVDKRLGIVKELESQAGEMKTFKPLSPAQMQAWIQDHVSKRGATIAQNAMAELLRVAGDNQWTLANELDKLCAYSPSIGLAEVDLLAVQSGSQVVWRLTDLIGSRKAKEALRFFSEQVERGEDPYGMWAILLNMVKNVAAIWVCIQSGVTSEKAITDATGVNFFSVRGLMPLAKSLDQERVRWLVNWAADSDIQLKTGGYKYTAEHTGELSALAERIIVACA
jgi:DNA polymerase III delta subunit